MKLIRINSSHRVKARYRCQRKVDRFSINELNTNENQLSVISYNQKILLLLIGAISTATGLIIAMIMFAIITHQVIPVMAIFTESLNKNHKLVNHEEWQTINKIDLPKLKHTSNNKTVVHGRDWHYTLIERCFGEKHALEIFTFAGNCQYIDCNFYIGGVGAIHMGRGRNYAYTYDNNSIQLNQGNSSNQCAI